jgi:hypothetical protein
VTSFGTVEPSSPSPGAVARYLIGIAGLAFSLTILWLSMRAVMDIGGACASGGPYVPAVECPDVVVALTPLSIFGLFLFGGLALWAGSSLGAGWAGVVALTWPALFLSLGWNFLEFGLRPPGAEPGELAWSWLFCAVVFFLMGGGPLLVALWAMRETRSSRSSRSPSGPGARVITVPPRGRYEVKLTDRRQAAEAYERAERGATSRPDVTSRLERLARLRNAGDLTDAEFQAAKRATLDEAGA